MSDVLVLDAGALIAIERSSARALRVLQRAKEDGAVLLCPAGALAQAWRGGARKARLAALLKDPATTVLPLDALTARRIGVLAALTSRSDVVDLSVALAARDHDAIVVTSDPEDIAAIDPTLTLIAV